MQLTPEQETFINAVANTDDNLRLDAVAGSGKTTTLLQAAKALPNNTDILALAFNKKIADELQKKLPRHVECRTLNGLGHRVWQASQGKQKLDARKVGTLVSDFTKKYAAQYDESTRREIYFSLLNLVEAYKSNGYIPEVYANSVTGPATVITPDEMRALCVESDIDYNLPLILDGSVSILQKSIGMASTGVIDFNDQLYMSTYFSNQDAWPKYNVIMVDEAQDLSPLQHDMIERAGINARIIVVGDAHQAIYGWRGASAKSLDEMTMRFDLQRYPLTVSFRCPENIIKEAKRFVPHIQHAPSNEGGQVRIAADAWDYADILPGSVVLCRNNAPLIKLMFKLIERNIPAYYTGREIGAKLKRAIDKLSDAIPLGQALVQWCEEQTANARRLDHHLKVVQIEDTYETLDIIMSGRQAKNKAELKRGIDYLLRKEYSPEAVELSTIHKAKGKEWDNVFILNSNLMPAAWLLKSRDKCIEKINKLADKPKGNTTEANELSVRLENLEALLCQEGNLHYVAITRAMKTLTYISIER